MRHIQRKTKIATTCFDKIGYILGIALALLLVSCGSDVEWDFTTPQPEEGVKFDVGFTPATRVATDSDFNSVFESGDAMGVYVVLHDAGTEGVLLSAGNYMDNVKVVFDGTHWNAQSAILYPEPGKVLDFYAYYPYDESATDALFIRFEVKTDQTQAGYNQSDLLAAKTTDIAKSQEAVPLTFRHLLSLIHLEVPAGNLIGCGPRETLVVTLPGVRTGGTLNLKDQAFATGSGGGQSVVMRRVEESATAGTYNYRALLPAQSITEGSELFTYQQDGNNWKYTLASDVHTQVGEAERFEISLPFTLHTQLIPVGSFGMGSPDEEEGHGWSEILHAVTLTSSYRMCTYQVTSAQYAQFLNAVGVEQNGLHPVSGERVATSNNTGVVYDGSNNRWKAANGCENHPACAITWYGAYEFARWCGGRLPTEAEWEYACRAGTQTAYSFGDDRTRLGDYAWYAANSGNLQKPVGLKLPNRWGLYDMHGNLLEWCQDWFAVLPSEGQTDPTGPADGEKKVLRGGMSRDWENNCRSASRFSDDQTANWSTLGFRIVFDN